MVPHEVRGDPVQPRPHRPLRIQSIPVAEGDRERVGCELVCLRADPPSQVTVEGRELRVEGSLEGAPMLRVSRSRRCGSSAAGYLPAEEETYLATAWIWAGLSFPLKAGMTAPPFVTWVTTIAVDGLS